MEPRRYIMVTDDELITLSKKVDIFLSTISVEHQLPALELSAVILARLILLNNELQNQKDFRNLLTAIADKPILADPPKVNIH
jgi:hypothetical protein